ncbi:MAG: MFS transporter [Gracilibacteraceae bacterium]|jgi:MFS family permease|nr:MFS transporter [Gracilibacteraceae bacterium]
MSKALRDTFRSLHYRNFRLFFSGQCISLIGVWLQNVAMGWLVYRLTGSELLLGVTGFCENLPMLVLTPFIGVLVDRWDRYRILLVTQTLCMLQAGVLAFLVLAGLVTVPAVLVLSVVLGSIMALDLTARQAIWVFLVDDKRDLSNAIALNASLFNVGRLLGPSLAGIVIALIGEGLCFLLNSLSYIAVLAALLAMRLTRAAKPAQVSPEGFFAHMTEGFRYVWNNRAIRYTMIMLAVCSVVAMQYLVMMPVFAIEVLQGDSVTLGFIVAGSGVGALVGTVYMAGRKDPRNLTRVINLGAALAGFAFIFFALSRSWWLSILVMLFLSFGIMVILSPSNILIQTIVDEDKRGRVMSLYALCFSGMAPLGSLYMGAASEVWGAPATFIASGVALLIIATIYPRMRGAVEAAVAAKTAESAI